MTITRPLSPRGLVAALTIALLTPAAALAPASGNEASADSLSQCTSGYMCVWAGTNYTGSIQKFSATGSYKAITLSTINSMYNNRSDRAYIHEQSNGSGVYACYNPGQKNANLSGWLETANAVYLSTVTNC